MGITAVPGAGKTQVLSFLAASLIARGVILDEQEILVVTLVNSAVDNFSNRIESFIKQNNLIPRMGYRVRTLHALAYDIVRERPDLAGISDRIQISDEIENTQLIQDLTHDWMRDHSQLTQEFIQEDELIKNRSWVLTDWDVYLANIAKSCIRLFKDKQILPEEAYERVASLGINAPIISLGVEVYSKYQKLLYQRGKVDFDDLIWLAQKAITNEDAFLLRLRNRWPFILEDEAQDSSRLQESILSLLVGSDGNWIRVGDPNQAIYETFTTANPQYLMNYCARSDVVSVKMPHSGRSSLPIIELANYLVDWSDQQTINPEMQKALTTIHIEPTPPNDPQPNPTSLENPIVLFDKALNADDELKLIVKSLSRWLPDHPNDTVAVLVSRNERGFHLVELLDEQKIPYFELLRTSQTSRNVLLTIAAILQWLVEPLTPNKMVHAINNINKLGLYDFQSSFDIITSTILKITRMEDFLFPIDNSESVLDRKQYSEVILHDLDWIKNSFRRWASASILPIDQLVLSISTDLFTLPNDLALTYSLAQSLQRIKKLNPDWSLEDLSAHAQMISTDSQQMNGVGGEIGQFDPSQHPGKVVVSTIHKAKGLEWDRVYVTSVNDYDFPFGLYTETYAGEKWYLKGKLNLHDLTLDQIKAICDHDMDAFQPETDSFEVRARNRYAAERLRLLYVAITRARKEVIITWNSGRRKECNSAVALKALNQYLKKLSEKTYDL
jgi:DNA helicase-2/ATP-dependent DNA helicase PcrA